MLESRSAMVAGHGAVFAAELRAIMSRRRTLGIQTPSTVQEAQGCDVGVRGDDASALGSGGVIDVRSLRDSLGVAFSGGGIRSAAFSCGVLTALAGRGVLPRVDYLSCVSGGGYATTAFLTHLQSKAQPSLTQPLQMGVDPEQGGRSRQHSAWVGWAPRDVCSTFESATSDLEAQMTANSSYLVRRCGNSNTSNEAHCIGVARDVAGFAWAMASMLAGMPVLVASVALLIAILCIQLVGSRLKSVMASSTLASLVAAFSTEAWACVGVAVLALLLKWRSKHWVQLGSATVQAYNHLATLVLAAIVSAWSVAVFIVLDERLSGTEGDEMVEGAILLLVVVVGVGAAMGVVSVHGGAMAAACFAAPLSVLWLTARLTAFGIRNGGIPKLWVGAAAGCVVASVACFESITNRLHHYYRRRLRQAFYHGGKDVALRSLDTKRLPYLLCNTVMNDYVRHVGDPKCSSFVLSPLYCGGQLTGFRPTPHDLSLSQVMAVSGGAVALAMGNADAQGHLRLLLGMLGISLGRWFPLTASGHRNNRGVNDTTRCPPAALLQQSMGTSVGTAVLVAGAICASAIHPAVLISVCALFAAAIFASLLPSSRWMLQIGCLRHLHQALGVVHVGSPPPCVYLSDGGHLDNLGIIELLKRRVSQIVAFDCGHDPTGQCEDLLTAIALAQQQLGCSFLPFEGASGDYVRAVGAFVRNPHATRLVLRIQYFADAGVRTSVPMVTPGLGVSGDQVLSQQPTKEGTLVYVKSRVTPAYASTVGVKKKDTFPHHSTAHQFYDPVLFQRYADLGRTVGVDTAELLVQTVEA